jgi:hypothetical protein
MMFALVMIANATVWITVAIALMRSRSASQPVTLRTFSAIAD